MSDLESGRDSELQELQKLEMLGLMAASVAHNLNNQLSRIISNVDEVFHESGENLRVQAALAEIKQAAEQSGGLCRQLVSYSRPAGEESTSVNLSEVIVDMASLLVIVLPKPVALQIACDPDLPEIEANLNQVRHVLLNLLINAGSAMKDTSGTVLLRLAHVELSAAEMQAMPHAAQLEPGRYLLLEVADGGPGLDGASLQHMFEPFLTPDARGLGLGLAMVLAIARSQGGFVHVISAPGQGTAVQVYFKPSPDQIPDVVAAPEPASMPSSNTSPSPIGSILLVDDDPAILNATAKMLGRLGYPVVTASDGVLGVEKFLIHRTEVVCVILDLNMPYMNGAETLKSLREAGCEIPVIIASGFSRLLITQEMRDQGIAAFLEKPYTLDMLGRTLEKVFNPTKALFL